jgi:hypothetical protein
MEQDLGHLWSKSVVSMSRRSHRRFAVDEVGMVAPMDRSCNLASVERVLGVASDGRWGGAYLTQGREEALTGADEMGVVEA